MPIRRALALLLLALPPLLHADDARPLKVFVLVGQSNMQGHAHVRTLPHLASDPKTAALLKTLQSDDGTPRVHQAIDIAYLSRGGVKRGKLTTGFGVNASKIGPELSFGVRIHQRLQQPILIIKAAWGGKSLHTDFRPPSAQGDTGRYYSDTIRHVKATLADLPAEPGYELAGFVWFQGWNDMVAGDVYPDRGKPGGYAQYTELLAHLIRDVRRDLDAPALPFVIGVMGVGGPTRDYGPRSRRYAATHQHFRDAMAAPARLPAFAGTVTAVLTERYWDAEIARLHERRSRILGQSRKLRRELGPEKAKAAIAQQLSEALTKDERARLDRATSNAAYHYLGSATILARIGVAFADAAADLLERRDATPARRYY